MDISIKLRLISSFLLFLAPLIVIGFNTLKYFGLTKSEKEKNIEEAWKKLLREGELERSDEYFEEVVDLLLEQVKKATYTRPNYMDEIPDQTPIEIFITSGFGTGKLIYLKFEEDEKDHISFIHPESAKLIVNEHIEHIQSRRARRWYSMALVFLFIGFAISFSAQLFEHYPVLFFNL